MSFNTPGVSRPLWSVGQQCCCCRTPACWRYSKNNLTTTYLYLVAFHGSMDSMIMSCINFVFLFLMSSASAASSASEAERYWENHRTKLLEKFRIAPDLPSWIESHSKPEFCVGCLVCRAFYKSKPCAGGWANCSVKHRNSLRECKLAAHEGSKWHRDAVTALLGIDIADTNEDAAPSPDEFKKVLNHVRHDPIGHDGVPGVAGWRKSRQMLWCLAEASRAIKRTLWKVGALVSATIFQDGRKGKLTVRVNAASDEVKRRRGYMGTVDLARDFSLDALGIQAGTMEVVRRFCTPRHSPPLSSSQHTAEPPIMAGDS